MKTLSTSYISQYYYVQGGVIFNIKGYDDKDPCAVNADTISGSIPSISVTNTGLTTPKTETLYLDVYIEDGDTYASNAFKKTVHKKPEESVTFQAYYKSLCEKEIENGILINIDKDYNWFIKHLDALGVPKFMIKDQGYTVTGIEQFNFTEEYLNNKKDIVIQKEVQKAAENRAASFKYKVTNQVAVAKDS